MCLPPWLLFPSTHKHFHHHQRRNASHYIRSDNRKKNTNYIRHFSFLSWKLFQLEAFRELLHRSEVLRAFKTRDTLGALAAHKTLIQNIWEKKRFWLQNALIWAIGHLLMSRTPWLWLPPQVWQPISASLRRIHRYWCTRPQILKNCYTVEHRDLSDGDGLGKSSNVPSFIFKSPTLQRY